jgi:lysophospholipase L1-like esterase
LAQRSTRLTLAVLITTAAVGAATVLGAGGTQARNNGHWQGTWATAITKAGAGSSGAGFTDQSIRMTIHTSVGGDALRVRLTDEFGDRALVVGHATVALPAAIGSPDLDPASVHELTFSGSQSVTIYQGSDALSDTVTMDVPALSDLVVTIYLPGPTGPASWHFQSRETTYFYSGDHAIDPSGAGFIIARNSFYFLAGVDVHSRSEGGSVVALGDSITDGQTATINANHRWPDFLAARIVATGDDDEDPGVLNQGIAGNKVTHDGSEIGFNETGLNGLARLDADVYGQTDVRAVIVELGINDIQAMNDSPDRIIAGLHQLAVQLRENGIRVIVSTITPFEGFVRWTPEKELTREAVNDYIRTTHDFNAVVDFAKVLEDPAAPTKIRADLDSGDHIHPTDAGYQLMAGAVPLWLL